MYQVIPTKCPNCEKLVTHLSFWKLIDEEAYHLCDECLRTPLSDLHYFKIGLHYGYQKHKQELREFLK